MVRRHGGGLRRRDPPVLPIGEAGIFDLKQVQDAFAHSEPFFHCIEIRR